MALFYSFFIAVSGGCFAYWLNIPLPWTLGPLFTSIIWNISSARLVSLRGGRKVGQYIIGFSLGLYFTHEVVNFIVQNLGLLFLGVFLCLAVSFIVIYCNSFYYSSLSTAYFTYLPGGASEMVNISDKYGGDKTHIAIGHTVRIILLVFSVPFIAKYLASNDLNLMVRLQGKTESVWELSTIVILLVSSITGVYLWRWSKQANPWMLGALVGTGVITYFFDLTIKVPVLLIAFAQILLAMSLAQPITLITLKSNLTSLHSMIISSSIVIICLIGLSYILSLFFNTDFLTIGLGMMPGGISEMSLTAEQLNLNVAIVSTMQTIRLLVVMLIAQPCFSLLLKLKK